MKRERLLSYVEEIEELQVSIPRDYFDHRPVETDWRKADDLDVVILKDCSKKELGGQVCHACYNRALLRSLASAPKTERGKFIRHQLQKQPEKRAWLASMVTFVETEFRSYPLLTEDDIEEYLEVVYKIMDGMLPKTNDMTQKEELISMIVSLAERLKRGSLDWKSLVTTESLSFAVVRDAVNFLVDHKFAERSPHSSQLIRTPNLTLMDNLTEQTIFKIMNQEPTPSMTIGTINNSGNLQLNVSSPNSTQSLEQSIEDIRQVLKDASIDPKAKLELTQMVDKVEKQSSSDSIGKEIVSMLLQVLGGFLGTVVRA